MYLYHDIIPRCVFDEIEMMTMYLQFGRSSVMAETHRLCVLPEYEREFVDKAVFNWGTDSAVCIDFLKLAFDLQESSDIRFAGVHAIQAQQYAVFAFSESCYEYYFGQRVWLIYYHINNGYMFMCYQPTRNFRGTYWDGPGLT